MSDPAAASTEASRRRSQRVALVLLGSAGVLGVALAIDGWREARQSSETTAPDEPRPDPVSPDRTYAHGSFLPGLGYYHAPFGAWFPFPWNFHQPGRGYFSGGEWRPAPDERPTTASRPSAAGLAAASALQARREAGNPGTGASAALAATRPRAAPAVRPAPAAPPASKPAITRGGFGSSGHAAGS